MKEQILQDVAAADRAARGAAALLQPDRRPPESGTIGEDPTASPTTSCRFIAQVAVGKRDKLHGHRRRLPDTPDGTGVRDYVHV